MGLRSFHIGFVTASVILTAMTSIYFFYRYSETGEALQLYSGIGTVMAGGALAVYFHWFLKKIRSV